MDFRIRQKWDFTYDILIWQQQDNATVSNLGCKWTGLAPWPLVLLSPVPLSLRSTRRRQMDSGSYTTIAAQASFKAPSQLLRWFLSLNLYLFWSCMCVFKSLLTTSFHIRLEHLWEVFQRILQENKRRLWQEQKLRSPDASFLGFALITSGWLSDRFLKL